jgi:adenylate cyclase
MQHDRHGTLASLDECRDLFRTNVNAHGGRVVDTAGDSVLAVFELATEALQAAVEIQESLEARNTSLPEEERMRFRIGVHVGEVMHKADGTIYGDGVNIAARLQAMAEPSGICLSEMVRGAVAGRIESTFLDIGEHEVKNISEPVHAYRVAEAPELPHEPQQATASRISRWALVGAAAVAGVVAAVALWALPKDEDPPPNDVAEFQTADPGPVDTSDSRGPSIAVLPFTNMSDDAGQEYFADGISEDLITELSRFEGLLVIARNSTFRFKGQAVDVSEVGEALGVRWVLEGGVRRMGDRIRVTAQLIDVETGGHIWAERYDRELTDVFAVQDEVTQQIIAALQTEIGELAPTRGFKRLSESHEAYDLFLRGRVEKERRTEAAALRARDLFNRAIALDPVFAAAYAELSDAQHLAVYYGWDVPDASRDAALRNAEKAVALDGSLPLAHAQLGRRQYESGHFDGSAASLSTAIALDTNYATGYVALAALYAFTGEYDLGRSMANKASQLDPYAVRPLLYEGTNAFAQENYDEAIAALSKGVGFNPDFGAAYQWLAAAHALAGNEEEARAAASNVLRISPDFVGGLESLPFVDPSVLQRLAEGLRLAGLEVPDLGREE